MIFEVMNFENTEILVIGDVMLDQYWFGGTSRISPEAPVPVVQMESLDERPGGAANAALGVMALGAKPTLLGIIGNDATGIRLEQLLTDKLVRTHFFKENSHQTITKVRVLSRNQQMIRLDTEKKFPAEISEQLKTDFLKLLEGKQAVILSDYGKGTLADPAWFIATARARNIPVIVDPKSSNFSVYRGANVIKPNLKEFEAVVGSCRHIDTMVAKALDFLKTHDIDNLIISRSEQGLSVITKEGQITHIAAKAREVHDVTGAGDTVVAVLATALASGMDLVKAATLGNIAGGIAVGKLGTAPVSIQEIQTVLGLAQPLTLGVMSEEALLPAIRLSKAKGERIVFTNGCFDILHSGHVLYLEQAKQLGDRVIVAVNDDASVTRLKGATRPINSLEDRMVVLAGLKSVDWVVSFSEATPDKIIELIAPHVLVKGGDYNNIEELPGARFVLSQGGTVQLLGLKEGCSTTNVIKNIVTQREEAATSNQSTMEVSER
jgi:D-beta-D-heptose 7-phosphate kinase/D-beta-D-heptose 1-phosphate adenosyltransferase